MTKNAKRILLFAYEYPPLGGGVATATEQLLKEFAKKPNLKIDLITSSLRNIHEVEKISENLGIYKVPIGLKTKESYQKQTLLNMFLYVQNSYLQAKDLLNQNKYDLAHFFGYPGAWQGLFLKKQFNLPFVISLRGVEVPFYNPRFRMIDWLIRPLTAKLWSKAAKVITNSQGLADLAKQTNLYLNYQIIPNGVDTSFFKPALEKQKYQKFTITAGGTILGRKKGLNYLITAFAQFAKAKKDVELLLIGDGDLRGELQQQVETLGISAQVKFVGRKDKNWLKENLSKCHVFCLPSLNEGMSNATLEAMACGLPIIMTPVGGAKELLENGKNGLLVPKRDAEQIVKRLDILYADAYLIKEMGKISRNKVEKLSWKNIADQYLNLYNND